MKKIIISMFLIMAAGILISCGKSKEEMDSYLVYYLNQDMTGLVEGTMESPHKKKDTNAVVTDLLKQLQTTGEDANLKSPISENVDVLDFELKNHQMSISFSAAYYERSGVEDVYKRQTHRHTPEIEEQLSYISGKDVTLNFTPHLIPMNRGILVTAYAKYKDCLLYTSYDSDTLAKEYFRDLDKGMNPSIPANYFPDDDPEKKPVVRWRSAGQLFYSNWLNYYVYQSTPYDVRDINK